MKIFVGCSGFFYWDWKGRFYPEKLKPSEWFTYYAQVFNTVEINSTFYNFPKNSNLRRWYRQSPENFVFSIKANKEITHIKRFKDVSDRLKEFYRTFARKPISLEMG
ncbi:DUF72 domain-containing protein [Persephonella sp.]